MKAVTTRSGLAYEEPDVLRTQPKPSNSYPSRLNDQKLQEKATNQMQKFFQIFHDLHFDISFADALLLMPKFASTIKSLLANKDKLFELANVSLNENCSAMLLKKHPEKLGDSSKFLIPCDFPGMEICHALADLGASINLMPLSIWKKLSLPELTPTRMTLELADRSITRPKRVAEDVFVKLGKFHFLTDFVMVDFEADPRVPLILGRSFLRTGHALIDVYGEEITLRVNDESITFNLNQTMRYSSTYDDTSVNRVDVIDVTCEDFVQDVLDFQYNPKSSYPTLVSGDSIFENDSCNVPIVKFSSLTLTSFGESDFILKEIEDFLNDDSIPDEIDASLVQSNKFHGRESENPHTHNSNFKRVTATLKYRDVPNDAIKLMLFSYSLEDAVRICKTDDRIDKLADQISNLVEIVNKQVITPTSAKAVEKTCVTCGGAHAYYDCIATDSNQLSVCAATGSYNQVSPPNRATHQIPPPVLLRYKTIQSGSFFQNQASTLGTLPSNTMTNPKGEMKVVTTRSGLAYEGPLIPTNSPLEKEVEQNTKEITDKELSNCQGRGLLMNKDKLFELAKVPLNENCSAMLLKKLLEKLRDPGKFLIPYDFPGMDVCHALADLDFEANPRVPLILGRSFLRIGRALIDVYGEEITLRVNDESATFNLNQTMRYSSTYDGNYMNRVDVIDIACEEFVQDVLDFQYNPKSSNPTLVCGPSISNSESCKEPIVKSSSLTLLHLEKGDIIFLEKLLNEDPFQLSPMDLKQAEETKAKSSIEEPPELELKELPSHLEYAFLEESDKLPVIIAKDLKGFEKEALIKVLKSHKWEIAWKISNIKGHKISKSRIEVDRMKVDVIAKLPHPTTIKGVRSFLGHAGFYRRFIQDFSKIARPMTHLLEKETHFVFSKECVNAFDTLKKKLTEALILVVPDWNLPFELMCDASDFAIGAGVLGFKDVNFDLKTAGDHQKLQLNELNELRDQAYENSVIYKERTKKLHDFKIKNRIFNVGDQVLLFNSRLKIFSEKLKTRWSGPFTITQ
nr:reverse transcriptase domain-containing protein [Tanacetum cinerariifolium]